MESLSTRSGFLPGLFGRKNAPRSISTTSNEKMQGPAPVRFFKRLPNGPRNHFIAMSGEFVGTFLFLFFAFAGTQVANTTRIGESPAGPNTPEGGVTPSGPNTSQLLYIALSFGFSLAVNAWIFFRVSGGLFNPAVTLGLCLIGAVPFSRGAFVFVAQMLGAMACSGVIKALFPGPLAVATTLGGGASVAQGLFIEMFLTAQLVFTIFMLAAEKHKGTFLAPVGIGLSLFIAELAGVFYTGGSLNPARSFGPCVADRSFPGYHWIYWIGPCLGAIIAAGFFWFIKACEYETANPGQDFDDLEASAFNPEENITRPVVHPNAVVERSISRDLDAVNSQERMVQSSSPPGSPQSRTRKDTNGSSFSRKALPGQSG